MILMRSVSIGLAALLVAGAANAQTLTPGSYRCRGFYNVDLPALNLQIYGDGRYSNLPATLFGTYEYRGGKIHFIGGHLAGEVGDKLDRDVFRLGVEICSARRG